MLCKILVLFLALAISSANIRTDTGVIIDNETISSGGNYWGYDTELSAGDYIVVTFDTNGTEKVTDDEIISIRIEEENYEI